MKQPKQEETKTLGTFLGVFTPTILTILGVILYLRTGWVLGHLGLTQTLIVVLLANAITLITTISFSAIATNIRVGVGGAYFIISRSLGIEVGAAVGVPLFLSQAFSVTLYAFGLGESLQLVWADAPVQIIAFIIVILVGALSFKGADFALKIQLPIMALVGISMVVLAVGAFLKGSSGSLGQLAPSGEIGFWLGFAVFFPAVTGIMAGLGLSGDLKDPQKSIPRGAILATLTGLLVYLCVPLLLGMAQTPEQLRQDPNVWSRIAIFGPVLILPGLWGAIFSSAVGSMLGAPRTLQALVGDFFRSKRIQGWIRGGPGLAAGMVASLVIALGAVFLGDLNAVAPLVTMFFLTVYGTVNLVAAIETLSGDPSWRPKIRLPWQVSIVGGIACIGVMFLIDPIISTMAIAIELLIFFLLLKREKDAQWGDARRGMYESIVRWALLRLARRPMRARNWRPHVLIFVDNPEQRLALIHFGCWFSQERGVVTINQLVEGDLLVESELVKKRQHETLDLLKKEGIIAFAEVNVVPDVLDGMTIVAQANGLAGLQSNTIVVGWPKTPERQVEFLRLVRRMSLLHISTVMVRQKVDAPLRPENGKGEIHVWWGGLQRNSDLMLLLAHLLTLNKDWRQSRIKVNSVASNELAQRQTTKYLAELLPEIRINAQINVIQKREGSSIREIIQAESANADVVFLGLASPEKGAEFEYAARMEELAGELKSVFFVKNASLFVGHLLGSSDQANDTKPPMILKQDP